MRETVEARILFVDDEPNVLAAIKRQLYRRYQVDTAVGPEEGLKAVTGQGPYAVVVSDMRMPGMNGAQFLAKVRELFPDTVRMILTGYAELEAAMEAVNEGHIFRFLTKPCSPEALVAALEQGLEHYRLVTGEKQLLAELAEMNRQLKQQQQLLQTIFAAIPDLIILKDTSLAYQAVNPAFCQFLGKSEADILGRRDADLFPAAEAQERRRWDEEILAAGESRMNDEEFTGVQGQAWFQVLRSPVMQNGVPVGLLSACRNISARKKAQEVFQRHKSRLQNLAAALEEQEGGLEAGSDGA